ncbi:MAG: low-complexity tail membrane protein [Waterburya sp.]
MKTFRSETFLWIHLAGIALFPAMIGVTFISLAVGDSFPYFVELPLLAAIAILPILLMQLLRPFDIFSVLFISLKPESLNEEQRKILSLFQTAKQKFWSIITAGMMLLLLWLLYRLSPLAIGITGFLPQWRILGLAISGVAFLASNLFLQIPLSVLQVLITKEAKFTQTKPYSSEKIEQDFTVPGVKVSKINWFVKSPSENNQPS